MKHIKSFIQLLEKSIGSEEIRNKWYSDLSKKTFYRLVNLDPTSVRKKDFSKPGKYSKWLIKEYKKDNLNDNILQDADFCKRLNYYLFIHSTRWFRKKRQRIMTSRTKTSYTNDSFNNIDNVNIEEFMYEMARYVKQYEAETEKAKYDLVYEDDKIKVLVPLNFTASFETAKNTQWCSQQFSGYSMWNYRSILFRIVPIKQGYDKLKLTWDREGSSARWYIACSEYPEVFGSRTPFDKFGDVESWSLKCDELEEKYGKKVPQMDEIRKTMTLLSSDAKKFIIDYYNKYKKTVIGK
jgi:hypothetical protein